ncbi:hypothetical protein D7V80_11615 [Corallococcus sp. CA054B]|nr:hypothetical protein D7V80_11615 [Corallococcus sp. CA054B]
MVGPHAGKDIELGGFRFEEGECILPSRGSEHAQRILSRYYSAYPEGSVEGRAAHQAWKKSQEEKSSAGEAAPAVSARDVTQIQDAMEDLRAELEASRRLREELEARLARAEAMKAAGTTPATEAPAAESQEKPPKPGKAAK